MNVKDNSSFSLLMKDRPEIAKILNGHDSLKRWLAEQFSGKQTGFPIQWDPKELESSDTAEHMYPVKSRPAYVRVSSKISGIDQLSGVIFELFNIRYHKKHRCLWKKAYNGKVGKKEYNYQSLRLEYKAMKKCKHFLKKHHSVFATADDSNEAYKIIMTLGSFRDFFAKFERSDVKTCFEKKYEEKIAPRFAEKQ